MAAPIFEVKDCALVARMGDVDSAMNLRELRERVTTCAPDCLFHHFHETLIRPSFDDPEFRNDLAVWAAHELRDRVLAERLGILDPYDFSDLEELRAELVDILDERLAELPHVPWAPRGHEFTFMQAVTVVFDTGVRWTGVADLVGQLPGLSLSSVYYHFVEARRRTPARIDDFSAWLLGLAEPPTPLLARLSGLDFYWLSLPELKVRLLDAVAGDEGRHG